MTHYVETVLTLKHNDPNKIQAAVDAFQANKLLSYLWPEPEFIGKSVAHQRAGQLASNEPVASIDPAEDVSGPDCKRSEPAETWEEFLERWRADTWGTRWDVGPYHTDSIVDQGTDFVVFRFGTRWNPPLGAFLGAYEFHGFATEATYHCVDNDFSGIFRCDRYGTFNERTEWTFDPRQDDAKDELEINWVELEDNCEIRVVPIRQTETPAQLPEG